MTFQEAAHAIVSAEGRPSDPEAIARIAYRTGMVGSRAIEPIRSFVETIKKNIRGDRYNSPELRIIVAPGSKLIGLPEWSTRMVFP